MGVSDYEYDILEEFVKALKRMGFIELDEGKYNKTKQDGGIADDGE